MTIDEAPPFLDQPTDLGDVLARSSEYGTGMTLIARSLRQFPDSLRDVALGCARSRVAFGRSAVGRQRLSNPRWAQRSREEHLHMTMRMPRFSGPNPLLRAAMKPDRACTIAIHALCRGPFGWRVKGVTGAAARQGQAHIALRYGRILIYLEDRAELDALVDAVEAACELREQAFGPDAAKYLAARWIEQGADQEQDSDDNRVPEAAEA